MFPAEEGEVAWSALGLSIFGCVPADSFGLCNTTTTSLVFREGEKRALVKSCVVVFAARGYL